MFGESSGYSCFDRFLDYGLLSLIVDGSCVRALRGPPKCFFPSSSPKKRRRRAKCIFRTDDALMRMSSSSLEKMSFTHELKNHRSRKGRAEGQPARLKCRYTSERSAVGLGEPLHARLSAEWPFAPTVPGSMFFIV